MRRAWLAATVVLAQSAPGPLDVSRMMVSAPVSLTHFTGAAVHGFPARLDWSPDGRQLHIRVVQRDRWANEKEWHYLVSLADGTIRAIDREPDWSAHYWLWKSALACPGAPTFGIEIESRVEQKTPTNSGAGGALAMTTGDPYGPGFQMGDQGLAVVLHAMQAQFVTTTTLRLKGQVLAEFVNTQVIEGLWYGWGPEGQSAIAYAGANRSLVIMDQHGRRYTLRGTAGVLLPAWSDDGTHLAWIEQHGGGKYDLKVSQVTRSADR
jgi:hypothetical protein